VATTLSKMKGGFCVSTVSIVSGRVPGSTGVVAGCIYYLGRRLAQPKIVIVGADDADGADGIFGPRMDPDHPGSGSAFMAEGNLNTRTRRSVCAPRKRPREFRREPGNFHPMSSQGTLRTWPDAGSCYIEALNPRFAPR
jgi:hypothetical protein